MDKRPFNLGNLLRPVRGGAFAFGALAAAFSVLPVRADIDPVSGIDFVRIGAVGNEPWPGVSPPVQGDPIGRGGVNHEYHIGRYEWTTAQAVEFFNAAMDRSPSEGLPHLIPPTFWGAVATTPTVPGGRRWVVPEGNELRPVGNISWRMAAMVCNWLHNGKATNREAFLDGAYDVSTFGYVAGIFTDQLEHSPGARYWIPTFDEMLKASHYDPDRDGQGQGGWWLYNNSSDTAPVGGPPGVGDGNFNWAGPGGSQFTVPLGSYPQTQSPWGLLDLAGATAEWTEEVSVSSVTGTRRRFITGSYWSGPPIGNEVYGFGTEFPSVSTLDVGFRLASSVPSASSWLLVCGCLLPALRRTRRKGASCNCSERFWP